ncbi:hypothetical protein ACLI4U_03370 [Natrialbaceae archaeon A-CW2]|uniref:hypothetical protein n=1 Tax=Natronosalvus amylolyticus TaxID=2961994 RepID=UPI0020C95454|nr:hypothetical protein [Natronosalvus amylolyticus]
MSTAHERQYVELTAGYWSHLVIAGLVAGILMGVVMHEVMGMIQAVGALYGTEGTTAGWVFHLWHAIVFALVYGGFFMWGRLQPFHDRILASTTLGIVWATVLWVGAAGVLMPLWLGSVGVTAPSVPALNPVSGLGHVLYGGVVGGLSAALHKRL